MIVLKERNAIQRRLLFDFAINPRDKTIQFRLYSELYQKDPVTNEWVLEEGEEKQMYGFSVTNNQWIDPVTGLFVTPDPETGAVPKGTVKGYQYFNQLTAESINATTGRVIPKLLNAAESFILVNNLHTRK